MKLVARFECRGSPHASADNHSNYRYARFCGLILLLFCQYAMGQSQYEQLRTQSASLSEEDRGRALKFFSVGFELWRLGDCKSAILAFRDGLALDPANPQANFYLGECLSKLSARDEATQALKMAAIFGAGTPEGYKATALLETLAKPPVFSELSVSEKQKLFVGMWAIDGDRDSIFTIEEIDGKLAVSGQISFLFSTFKFFGIEMESSSSIRFGVTRV